MAFSKGAPGCCCCRDIWQNGVGQYRIKGSGTGATVETIDAIGNAGDYDPVNRISFGISLAGTRPLVISKRIEQTEPTHSDIFTGITNSDANGALACHPEGQKVYYTYHVNGSGSINNFIRRIDYDGTNDTAIATIPALQFPLVIRLMYHRVLDRLYYTKRMHNGTEERVYIGWIPAAGGAETLIYDIDSLDAFGFTKGEIFAIELDYINEKVWWIELQTVSSVTTNYIKRSDYDGTNVETVYTFVAPVTRCRGIQVSYKDQCLYTWEMNAGAASSDTDGGLFKRDFDCVEISRLVTRQQLNAGGSINDFTRLRLGCGFETLGSNNQG